MMIFELIKAFFIGVVEGITEWLPVSSTGHMILFDEFAPLNVSREFLDLFLVVIQLGAILAVIVLFAQRLNPLSRLKSTVERRATWGLWGRVIVGCLPAAVVGFLLDDWMEANFFNAITVSVALIVYGVAFILVEHFNKEEPSQAIGRHSRVAVPVPASGGSPSGIAVLSAGLPEITWRRALAIGCFQCLAIVPGTSRSGSTILGGRILGVSRVMAAEFSFFLAIPVMFGWSLLKVVKTLFLDHFVLSTTEWGVFAIGIVTAFLVSLAAIRFLMSFIKKHSFTAFGWYRIILGIAVIVCFALLGKL
ncbi:MAG: undecaprenyl-diphosphate phosphatase [Actinomycetia bacterium]|nr:undecaprenyl-diphosphate phosphatase [Actinomycetes bacterium]